MITLEEIIKASIECYGSAEELKSDRLAFFEGADWARRTNEIAAESTNTDAFIEKASIWLKENAYLYVNDYTGSLNEDVLIDEFKKYMKGE